MSAYTAQMTPDALPPPLPHPSLSSSPAASYGQFDTPTFTITLLPAAPFALLRLHSTSFLNLSATIPWIAAESVLESYPLQTTCRIPTHRAADTRRLLLARGYRPTNNMLLAKF